MKMSKLKLYLKRLKIDSTKHTFSQPDYEGFFSTPKGDFHAVGWLNELSDLSLTIEKVTDEKLGNKFLNKKYFNWKNKKK